LTDQSRKDDTIPVLSTPTALLQYQGLRKEER
jgi:hypothetical protein